MGDVIDIFAAKKWGRIPPNIQHLLINNVFCSKCGVTTIIDYSLHNDRHGILMKGRCKKCGNKVARLIEDKTES